MRYYFTSLLAVAFSAAVTSAQNLQDIPQCAMGPALDSIGSTHCDTTNFKCICNNKSWLTSLLPDIEKDCSPDDLKKTEDFASKLCAAQSVTLSFSNTASATGTATGATNDTQVQATGTSNSTSVTPQQFGNAATAGNSAQKGGAGALLSIFAVAFGMAAWC